MNSSPVKVVVVKLAEALGWLPEVDGDMVRAFLRSRQRHGGPLRVVTAPPASSSLEAVAEVATKLGRQLHGKTWHLQVTRDFERSIADLQPRPEEMLVIALAFVRLVAKPEESWQVEGTDIRIVEEPGYALENAYIRPLTYFYSMEPANHVVRLISVRWTLAAQRYPGELQKRSPQIDTPHSNDAG